MNNAMKPIRHTAPNINPNSGSISNSNDWANLPDDVDPDGGIFMDLGTMAPEPGTRRKSLGDGGSVTVKLNAPTGGAA